MAVGMAEDSSLKEAWRQMQFLTLLGEEEARRIHLAVLHLAGSGSIPTPSESPLSVCVSYIFSASVMAMRLLSAHRLSSLLTDLKISHARQYTAAAAEAMRSSGVAAREFPGLNKAGVGGGNDRRTVFWMRDPATGDWIPEDHFGQTDNAELRQKLLSRK